MGEDRYLGGLEVVERGSLNILKQRVKSRSNVTGGCSGGPYLCWMHVSSSAMIDAVLSMVTDQRVGW